MTVLEAARAREPPPTASQLGEPRRLGNGAIQRVAARVMAQGGPMKLADIRLAIEERLGRPVSYASVEWCLRTSVGAREPWVERVRPGWYRIRAKQ